MFEKVNPSHPDKVADRIAGALVDIAYREQTTPRVAVEVLVGHGVCHIIAESSVAFDNDEVQRIVNRISGMESMRLDLQVVPQNVALADNQADGVKCGDNGIFRGVPTNVEEERLSAAVKRLYETYNTDGKFILAGGKGIACQSYATKANVLECIGGIADDWTINPLGSWTGGVNVDTGATNRKLGSDMGRAVTGGGLHGKDLSKADVAVNIYAHLKAQRLGKPVEICCAIGDETVDGVPYAEIVEQAQEYIRSVGGFEKFAEWGLI